MPSISELRKKIKGIKSTRQVTNAMKMVAGARFARAQREMVESSSFPRELEVLLKSFMLAADIRKAESPFFDDTRSGSTEKIGVIAVGGDKGLCGDFNSSVSKAVREHIRKNSGAVSHLFPVGTRVASQLKNETVAKIVPFTHIYHSLDFQKVDAIGNEVLQAFLKRDITRVTVVFNTYYSAMKHVLTIFDLLPIPTHVAAIPADEIVHEFEPQEWDTMISVMAPLYVKSRIYETIRRSFTAELAARMRAMDNATRNASRLVDTLTLEMNKIRQAMITREIAEITTTSEVMKE